MYDKISEFILDWTYESESTIKVFSNLTDESLAKKVHEKVRTAGRLAWHITTSIGEMAERTSLTFETVDENFSIPNSVSEIIEFYKQASYNMINEIQDKWNDGTLLIEDEMYGEMWMRGKTLMVIINHQIHHRAQLIVVMRMLGLKVPGIYGPAYEEWAEFGMTAQE